MAASISKQRRCEELQQERAPELVHRDGEKNKTRQRASLLFSALLATS